MAFICSEFSLSHYLPKVRFSDTAAVCLALHPGNYLPGNLSQNEISCLWHQGRHRQETLCAWPPPTFTPNSLLQYHGIKDQCGAFRIASWHFPGAIPLYYSNSAAFPHRSYQCPVLSWGKSFYHRPHTCDSILTPPCSASVKGRKPQSYTILVLKSIIFSPSVSCRTTCSFERLS